MPWRDLKFTPASGQCPHSPTMVNMPPTREIIALPLAGMSQDQHAKDALAIQELDRKNKILEKRLAAAHREPVSIHAPATNKLSRGSQEAYIGIAIGIVLAVVPMTWWLRLILFVILEAICMDPCWRSEITYKRNRLVKGILCIGFSYFIISAAWGNVNRAYKESEFPPNVMYMTSWGDVPGHPTVV